MLNEKVRFEHHRFKTDEEKTVGLSPVTVNTRIKTLRPFFKYLKEESLIHEDPMKSIKDVKEQEENINVLNVDELKRLLNAPNQRFYDDHRDACILTLLIDGFLRIEECLSLKNDDIDFDSGVLTIRASNAKNRKARIIPLQRPTLNMIRELIKETEEFGSDYLFLSNYGERLTANHFRKTVKKLCENCWN